MKVKRPCGYRYLVELLPNKSVESKKASGIVIPENTQYAKELEGSKRDVCVAKVIQKGLSTKIESDRKTNWADIDDYVLINRYSWFEVPSSNSEKLQMIVNDDDILAIVDVEEE